MKPFFFCPPIFTFTNFDSCFVKKLAQINYIHVGDVSLNYFLDWNNQLLAVLICWEVMLNEHAKLYLENAQKLNIVLQLHLVWNNFFSGWSLLVKKTLKLFLPLHDEIMENQSNPFVDLLILFVSYVRGELLSKLRDTICEFVNRCLIYSKFVY